MRHLPLLLAALSMACVSADPSQPLTKEVEEPGDVAVASNVHQALDHLLADFFSTADWSVPLGPEVKYPAPASREVAFRPVQPIPLTFQLGWPIREDLEEDTEVFSFRLSFR